MTAPIDIYTASAQDVFNAVWHGLTSQGWTRARSGSGGCAPTDITNSSAHCAIGWLMSASALRTYARGAWGEASYTQKDPGWGTVRAVLDRRFPDPAGRMWGLGSRLAAAHDSGVSAGEMKAAMKKVASVWGLLTPSR